MEQTRLEFGWERRLRGGGRWCLDAGVWKLACLRPFSAVGAYRFRLCFSVFLLGPGGRSLGHLWTHLASNWCM